MSAYDGYIAELFTFEDPFFHSVDLDFQIDVNSMEKTMQDIEDYQNNPTDHN